MWRNQKIINCFNFVQVIQEDVDALIASEKAKSIAQACGFSEVDQTKVAIATLELGRNIIVHAMGKGKITVLTEPEPALVVIAQDLGPGISDVESALESLRGPRKGLGVGLGAVKRLMDQLTIETHVGEGTTITAKKLKKPVFSGET